MAGQPDMIVLRALGALLAYPRPELRAALPEIADALRAATLVRDPDREAVLALVELLEAADPLWTEERYVELFDRGRATSLHLFEHLHGDARDRGAAMVDLKSLYERAGFRLDAKELPDYLPVLLEFLSCGDAVQAQSMLSDCAHILRSVGEALRRRGSPYSAVFQALLTIAGEPGMSTKPASRPHRHEDDLDADWAEQPAFSRAPPTPATPGMERG